MPTRDQWGTETSPSGGGGGGSEEPAVTPKQDDKVGTYTDAAGNVHVTEDYTAEGGSKYDTVVSGFQGGYSGSGYEREGATALGTRYIQSDILAEAGASESKAAELEKAGIITRKITQESTPGTILTPGVYAPAQPLTVRNEKTKQKISEFPASRVGRNESEFAYSSKYGQLLPGDIAQDLMTERREATLKNTMPEGITLSAASRGFFEGAQNVSKGIRDFTINTESLPKEIKESIGYQGGQTVFKLGRESTARLSEFIGVIPGTTEVFAKAAIKDPGKIPGMIAQGGLEFVGGTAKQAQEDPAQLVSDVLVTAGVIKTAGKIKTGVRGIVKTKTNAGDFIKEKPPGAYSYEIGGEAITEYVLTPEASVTMLGERAGVIRMAQLSRAGLGAGAVIVGTRASGSATPEQQAAYETAKTQAAGKSGTFEITEPHSPSKIKSGMRETEALNFNKDVAIKLRDQGINAELDPRGNVIKRHEGEFNPQAQDTLLLEHEFFNQAKTQGGRSQHVKNLNKGTEQPGIFTREEVPKRGKRGGDSSHWVAIEKGNRLRQTITGSETSFGSKGYRPNSQPKPENQFTQKSTIKRLISDESAVSYIPTYKRVKAEPRTVRRTKTAVMERPVVLESLRNLRVAAEPQTKTTRKTIIATKTGVRTRVIVIPKTKTQTATNTLIQDLTATGLRNATRTKTATETDIFTLTEPKTKTQPHTHTKPQTQTQPQTKTKTQTATALETLIRTRTPKKLKSKESHIKVKQKEPRKSGQDFYRTTRAAPIRQPFGDGGTFTGDDQQSRKGKGRTGRKKSSLPRFMR